MVVNVTKHLRQRDTEKELREYPHIELYAIQRKLVEHNEELRAVLAKAEEVNKVQHTALLRLNTTLQQDEHDLPAEINNAEALQVLEEMLKETVPAPAPAPEHNENDTVNSALWKEYQEELKRWEEQDRRTNDLEAQVNALKVMAQQEE